MNTTANAPRLALDMVKFIGFTLLVTAAVALIADRGRCQLRELITFNPWRFSSSHHS